MKKFTIILVTLVFGIFLISLACIPEQYKQTGDAISKGTRHLDDNTPPESPLKEDTKELAELAKAHSEQELGKPETPIMDKWDKEKSAEQRKTIEKNSEDSGLFGLNWSELLLVILGLERFLKYIGIYLPKGALNSLVKFPLKGLVNGIKLAGTGGTKKNKTR